MQINSHGCTAISRPSISHVRVLRVDKNHVSSFTILHSQKCCKPKEISYHKVSTKSMSIRSATHVSEIQSHYRKLQPEVSEFGDRLSTSPSSSYNWAEFEDELSFMTRTVRLVQWYPGHIAKAERNLKEQLKWVDVVLEVRDARIPFATTHPELDGWIGDKKKLVILNREDMVSAEDKKEWRDHYSRSGTSIISTNGKQGAGIQRLAKVATAVGKEINARRRSKGLLPRPVRAALIGFPNVGKSAIINRLLNRRVCASAPKPGVTRDIRWIRIGEDLDLLDAPGVLPSRIADQSAAARLAICNDIGEAAYAVAGVGSILVEMLKRIPTAGPEVLMARYKIDPTNLLGEEFLETLADRLFQGDVNQASQRLLKDFRRGALGSIALERPPNKKWQ